MMVVFSGFFVISGFVILWAANLKLPDFNNFDDRKVVQSTKIFDRTGEVILFDANKNIKRTLVDGGDISPLVKNAVVAIEDDTFYQHNGIEIRSILRAIKANLSPGGPTQGGSTITQQVIKNTVLTQEKKISRKIKEWVLALKLEQVKDKDEILSLYLNEIPYGGRIYGVQEASQQFFQKDPHEVTLAQAAYLAAIPNAPTYYSPYGNNLEELENRKNLVLRLMRDMQFITSEEYNDAKDEDVVFEPRADVSSKALHFVQYILEDLEKTYGTDMVENGGLRVYTTLDWKLQEKAESIVNTRALANDEAYGASNSALVAIDPRNGEILTMVGSRDYFDKEIDGNFNVALAHRQPGSSFKPFAYATAFKRGYTSETVVFDTHTQFNPSCDAFKLNNNNDCYAPQNYDGRFDGPITLRRALGSSRNIPSVKLLYLAGIQNVIRTAEDMGITGLSDANQYGLTLVLGGGEVRLLDMVSAYGVFANDGIRVPHTGILRVESAQGETLSEYTPNGFRALDQHATRVLNDVLSDNNARLRLFSSVNNTLYFPNQDVAGKTGTTNDNRDAWMVGYTPNLAVGVWSGNNDNSPMKAGSSISARTWREFMNAALPTRQKDSFVEPNEDLDSKKPILRGIWKGNETISIDTISGGIATELTPSETRGDLVITNPHSTLFWVDKNNPNGAVPNNPERDSQFENWELSVQSWLGEHPVSPIITTNDIPNFTDNIHTENNQPVVSLGVFPNIVSQSQQITLRPAIQSNYGIQKIDYFINNQFVGSSSLSPFSYTIVPGDVIGSGTGTLRVVATDVVYNRGTFETLIKVQ